MKTKLVYVLTCSPDKYYIEQAVMATFSSRYHNPEVHIVLIVDDKTNHLIESERGSILNNIDEKIVVNFDNDSSMIYRSRWIKTNVRQLIDGDYLFIDCDTITTCDLSLIDSFNFEVGAVPDSLLPVSDFCSSLYEHAKQMTGKIGLDLDKEPVYYNSGVMYVKDTPKTHMLYTLWHEYWLDSVSVGMHIDQPGLAKANRELGRIIQPMANQFNHMLWTRASTPENAFILHISSYMNPSFIFNEKVLSYVRDCGLNDPWLIQSVLTPCSTFLPFDYDITNSSKEQRKKWKKEISSFIKGYREIIDASMDGFPMESRFRNVVMSFLKSGHIKIGLDLWMFWKRFHLYLKPQKVTSNICKKVS